MIYNNILSTPEEVCTLLENCGCKFRRDAVDDFLYILYKDQDKSTITIRHVLNVLIDIRNKLNQRDLRYNTIFSDYSLLGRLDSRRNLFHFYFNLNEGI